MTTVGGEMGAVSVWLRLDLRRRRRSLLVLSLLVAFSGATVLATTAGARRADSAISRMGARTLPLDVAVLPNEPGFDWDAVRAMPQVAALSTFAVSGFALEETVRAGADPIGDTGVFLPGADDDVMRTVERPVVLEGRMFDPDRIDEAVVSSRFVADTGLGVGDTVTAALASPEQMDGVLDGEVVDDVDELAGPRFPITIVGVVRSLWYADAAGARGSFFPSPQVVQTYPANLLGASGTASVNALVRLRAGAAGTPEFQEALAALTGRTDIEVLDWADRQAADQRRNSFEAGSLGAFALAALLAALVLVGSSVARYTASALTEMRTLGAVGMTRTQSLQAAVAGPVIAAVAGASLAVLLAVGASRWFPLGSAALVEPDPGVAVDRLVLGGGWVLIPVLVVAGAAGSALVARRAARETVPPRRSSLAALAARLGWPVPVVVGARFALEPGRGRSAVPVRPALIGSVVGITGVVAAFTFGSGVADAAGNPARFGQTFALQGFLGSDDREFTDPDGLLQVLRADPAVTAVDDARSAVAGVGGAQTTLYTYDGAGGPPVDMVLSAGRPPEAADEVVLGPETADRLDVTVGGPVQVDGTSGSRPLTLVGIGFTPEGPHNGYADAGWVTAAGYDTLFEGFTFHFLFVALRPGSDTAAVLARLGQAAADEGVAPVLGLPEPPHQIEDIGQVRALPVFLAGFLALLAIGAVGHALATAVRRRRHDIAVLRTLGMTRRQSRRVVVVQATVLAGVGLVIGVPLGLALGRVLWQVVADYTPLQYVPPFALVALALIGPAALLIANLLAAWPGRTAARLRVGTVLRAE